MTHDDLGDPVSYMLAGRGLAILAADGTHVAELAHVLADEDEDLFEGLVIQLDGIGRGHRFADREHVAEIRERGVVLDLTPAQVEALPEPTANPAALAAGADDDSTALGHRLRRAWDLISGNY